MRMHPIFTQVKDWTGDGRPDGIEALVELQDQFGDPTKASGRLVFELYEYRPYNPDPRGERLAIRGSGELATLDDQARALEPHEPHVRLPARLPRVRPDAAYVLTATFELSGGGRFFDQIILEPRKERSATPARTRPSRRPDPQCREPTGPRRPLLEPRARADAAARTRARSWRRRSTSAARCASAAPRAGST